MLADNKDNVEEDETKLETDEDWLTHLEAKSTIKEQSPFTEVFQQLQASYQTKGGESSNPLYNIEYLNFLQFYFMPYIFVWSGFVYRGMNITRLTQGTIEKYFGTRKNLIKNAMVPARYINATLKIVLANCLQGKNEEPTEKIAEIGKYELYEIKNLFISTNLNIFEECERMPGQNDCDIWKRKRQIKRLNQTKKSIFKAKATIEVKKMKSKAGHYQKPQKTLNHTKSIITSQNVIPDTQQTPAHTMPTINEISIEEFIEKELHSPDEPMQIESKLNNVQNEDPIIIDDSPKPKNYCDICKRQFSSYATLYNHKKSAVHANKR